jgi:hypothetical protein
MLTLQFNKACRGARRGSQGVLSPDLSGSAAKAGMGSRADVIARVSATSMVQRSVMDETSAVVCSSGANLTWRFLSVN